MPYKDKKDLYAAQKRYRKRKRVKIVELKQLASLPLTVTRSVELIAKIKEL